MGDDGMGDDGMGDDGMGDDGADEADMGPTVNETQPE